MNTKYSFPDKQGYFGKFGGIYVPKELEEILVRLEHDYLALKKDKKFQNELKFMYKEYANRPSNLYFARNLTKYVGGARIYLKREDLNHTGAHKINNAIGQALLAKALGKKKLIAETGAGQHGTATATVAAYFGMSCDVYMGARDIKNQKPNVYRMKILGAKVIEVRKGQSTLKDAVDEALMAYIREADDAYYLLGSAVGPRPYPMMVRDFQSIIGKEAKKQILDKEGRLPDALIACVGGGSNAIGIFSEFISEENVELIAVEPAGLGSDTNKNGLSLMKGQEGIIHGFNTLVLKDQKGQIRQSYSAASGLDYPGVGPELSYLKEIGRLEAVGVTDQESVKSFEILSKIEGIIPALESAHAISYAIKYARHLGKGKIVIVNLSGRGDKDVENVYENLL